MPENRKSYITHSDIIKPRGQTFAHQPFRQKKKWECKLLNVRESQLLDEQTPTIRATTEHSCIKMLRQNALPTEFQVSLFLS